jgi:DNA-binding response OmpR family regulator
LTGNARSALIVLIEDDAALTSALERGLREGGFEVSSSSDGASGIASVVELRPSVVVLDLSLPDLDGLVVVRGLRERGLLVPVLILSVRDSVESRVAGLEAGADDYLVKPFFYPELLARLRALLRRAQQPLRTTTDFADLELAPSAQGVLVRGKLVRLSPRELGLLELLLGNRGEVLLRQQIMERVFGYPTGSGTNVVDVHVAHLRRKLGSAAGLLQTIRGVGYRIKPSAESD